MPTEKRFDVTAIGSTMLRLSVPSGERLESAGTFQVHTAGTESNTLTALSRMGLKTGWVSRLGDSPLGRRVAREVHSFGVDTSRVIWAPGERNEVFFVEYGASPRGIQVIYDRGGAAVSRLTFDQLDLDYLLDTRVYHATGILAALSAACRDTALKAMQAARAAGVQVSFDVNYRSKLWDASYGRGRHGPFHGNQRHPVCHPGGCRRSFSAYRGPGGGRPQRPRALPTADLRDHAGGGRGYRL